MSVGVDRGRPCPLTVVTDAPEYARSLLLGGEMEARQAVSPYTFSRIAAPPAECGPVIETFFASTPVTRSAGDQIGCWRYLLVSGFSGASQYGRLIDLARASRPLPDGMVCVARTGRGFQGFHGRSWVAMPGNLHLSLHLAPGRPIERFETIFMALAAVSVVEAIDATAGLGGLAGIRWVNDVVIDDCKVAGVLAYSQTRGSEVSSVILGIGLNVESRPDVPPTAFVPRVGSLRDFAPEPSRVHAGGVLRELLAALARNYRMLLEEGWESIMERYRQRSTVIGKQVDISWDEPDQVPRVYARGRVLSISDGMELFIEGSSNPIRRGRLILPPEHRHEAHPYALTLGLAS